MSKLQKQIFEGCNNIFFQNMKYLILILIILKCNFCLADEVYLKIGMYRLDTQNQSKVEIDVIGYSPSNIINQSDFQPSELKISLKINIPDGGNFKVHSTYLSGDEEKRIVNYNFKDGLELFDGTILAKRSGLDWNISFREAFSKLEVLSINYTQDEFVSFIEMLRKSIILKNSFQENWIKLSTYQMKTKLIQKK